LDRAEPSPTRHRPRTIRLATRVPFRGLPGGLTETWKIHKRIPTRGPLFCWFASRKSCSIISGGIEKTTSVNFPSDLHCLALDQRSRTME
jgi:hypothetical protein